MAARAALAVIATGEVPPRTAQRKGDRSRMVWMHPPATDLTNGKGRIVGEMAESGAGLSRANPPWERLFLPAPLLLPLRNTGKGKMHSNLKVENLFKPILQNCFSKTTLLSSN